ncbi:uncharacterized protein ACLA_045420 [Aspergillus clavatus NRRL 1]|uniref:Uncharacterized protein n=1 Tax=Aspergillus clavatus (strain ATCC 1007 / CBS 513.65 / DSM 816 / NCTC 3887 / NRRL 1 / QM 1276 / 107) TaxID=344612 RepID=A1CGS2_ASPCL|nr:uncharacterized protein ACLA_045420 [Aspergillus clavatus NRRL 1]EAW10077.1 conserved hypothetical protein [Aspergillus clavatus NRRL 1]
MQPPSDAFLHHSHKLREAAANLRNRVAFTPPPPYSSTDTRGPIQEERQTGVENEDDDYIWDASSNVSPSPITINIDASINVVGNGNTIMIPSMTGQAQQGISNASSRATPQEAATSPSPAGKSEPTTLRITQKHRQAKLTEMATSIINALYESGRLTAPGENCELAPVEININTGIRVEGSRNAVCVGVPVRLQSSKGGQTGAEKQYLNSNRKRRALSEPLEVPTSKKNCLT